DPDKPPLSWGQQAAPAQTAELAPGNDAVLLLPEAGVNLDGIITGAIPRVDYLHRQGDPALRKAAGHLRLPAGKAGVGQPEAKG
ncbi:hypothetical protein DK853_36260, partial [Klebsiella oxytoca]